MKNRNLIKAGALALAIVLGLSTAACGKSKDGDTPQEETAGEAGNSYTKSTSFAGQRIWNLPDPELAAFAASYSSMDIVKLDYIYLGEAAEYYETTDKALIDSVFRALDLILVDQETDEFTADADERFVFNAADGSRYTVRFNNRNYEVGRSAYTVTGDGELWKLARKIQENPVDGAVISAAAESGAGAGTDAAQASPQAGAGASQAAVSLLPEGADTAQLQGAAALSAGQTLPQGQTSPDGTDAALTAGQSDAAAAQAGVTGAAAPAQAPPAQEEAAPVPTPQAGLASSQVGLVDGQLVMNNPPEGPVYAPAESVYSEPYAMLVYYAEPYYGQVLDNGDVRINLKEEDPWPYVDITRFMDGTDAQTVMTQRSAAFNEEHAGSITASPDRLTPLMLENSAGYVSVGAYTEGDVNKNVLSIGVDTENGSVIFTAYYDDADTEAAVIAVENAFTLTEIGGVPIAQ